MELLHSGACAQLRHGQVAAGERDRWHSWDGVLPTVFDIDRVHTEYRIQTSVITNKMMNSDANRNYSVSDVHLDPEPHSSNRRLPVDRSWGSFTQRS